MRINKGGVMKSVLVAAFLVMVVGGDTSARGLYEGYALADGIVTERTMTNGEPSSSKFCYISYKVTLDGQEFSGRNNGISDFCYL